MSASWSSGYVGDVAYTLGFYRELAPTYLNFACLMNGVEGVRQSGLRYCELGCGRGYGTALLAAANPDCEFVGIDFNPTHIAEARALARQGGLTNITFVEASFGEAAQSNDPKLAEFDIIAMHGVYSWVMPKVREEIREFYRTKLMSGGLIYISYNSMPGWAAMAPVQRVFVELAGRTSSDGFSVIKQGLDFFKTMIDNKSGYFSQNPSVATRVNKMGEQDRRYLVHEFINVGWEALFVTDVMKELSDVKLTYIGSATLTENRLDYCVPKNLHEVVRAAPDAALRELYKDYVLNKQFRRDIYVKGPMQISARELRSRLNETTFVASFAGAKLPEKWRLPIGEFALNPKVAAALTERLQAGLATGSELMQAAQQAGSPPENGPMLLELMVSTGILTPARKDYATVDRSPAIRLNTHILEQAAAADTHRFLAMPVTGSAVSSSFVERVVAPILLENPDKDAKAIAKQAFDRLKARGQSFHQSGKPISGTDADVEGIAKIVTHTRDVVLPQWRMLGAVEGRGGKQGQPARGKAAAPA